MISSIFGKVTFKAYNGNYARFYAELLETEIQIFGLQENCGVISGTINIFRKKALTALCDKHNMTLEAKQTGIVTKLSAYKLRYGIVIGLIVAFIAVMVMSNHVMKIRIIGADEQTQEAIMSVLEQQNVGIGTFIPSISLYRLDMELAMKVPDVSWAGVRTSGSTLIISVNDVTEIPPMKQKRLPANIISTKNAQITDAQVLCGRLNTLIGNGVVKGEILISGEYNDIYGNTMYRYAQGKIYGTYIETVVFEKQYNETIKVISDEDIERIYLSFFDARLKLGFADKVDGLYIERNEKTPLRFLGLELPIGIVKKTYNEYSYSTVSITQQEAEKLLYEQAQTYEKNFLNDEKKILDRDFDIGFLDDKAVLTVTYTVNGEIGEVKEFLPKK